MVLPSPKMTVSDWIERDELLSALGRQPSDAELEWFGITRGQFRAWCRRPGVRVSVALGRLIRYRLSCNLGELLGPSWSGFTVHGARVEFPGLNRAVSPDELRALWFAIQQRGFWEHEAARQKSARRRAETAQDAAEKAARYYRSQVSAESRLAALLLAHESRNPAS